MMRLVGVEVRRMRARRVNVILFGAIVLGMLTAGTILFFKSGYDIAGATAAAQARARSEQQQCLKDLPPEIRNGQPPQGIDGKPELPCGPSEEEIAQITADPRFHMQVFLDVIKHTSPPMIVLALLAGASFIGAEWHQRTIATTLTWEPRRVRLLAAKGIACAAVIFVSVLALQAILAGVLAPSAAFRGDFAGTGWTWARSVAGAGLRAASTAAVASIIGIAIATIGRNTVAAVGVAFGYFAVLEGIVRGLKPAWQRWLLGDNAAVFVSGERLLQGRSVLAAGILISIYAVGAFCLAAASFRARDVAV